MTSKHKNYVQERREEGRREVALGNLPMRVGIHLEEGRFSDPAASLGNLLVSAEREASEENAGGTIQNAHRAAPGDSTTFL